MNISIVLFLLYMAAPKLDLFVVPVPIRPEDIISAIALLVYLGSGEKYLPARSIVVRLYLLFIAVNFLSAVLNIGDLGLTGFIYSARLAQYLVWYYILYDACLRTSWHQLRNGFAALIVVLLFWGALEFTGAITPIGKFGAVERLTINTSGPFETSVMLAMLAYAIPSWFLTIPLLVLVLLTQARITPVGMVFSWAFPRPVRAVLAAAAAFLLYSLVAQPFLASLQDTRFSESESPERMWRVLSTSWERAPVLDGPAFFRNHLLEGPTIFRYMVDTQGDLSFRFRAVRWPTLIKTTVASPTAFVVGWGPGAWENALDNYYVRIFGETGLIGLAVFLSWLVVAVLRLHPKGNARFAIVMMAVVGLFIDIFTSSKTMPLMWMMLAAEHAGHPFAIPRRRAPWRRHSKEESAGTFANEPQA